jgi:hypothetical protein
MEVADLFALLSLTEIVIPVTLVPRSTTAPLVFFAPAVKQTVPLDRVLTGMVGLLALRLPMPFAGRALR